MSIESLSCEQSAALLRDMLTRVFPRVEFSVCTGYYDGATIYVYYDGIIGYEPLEKCYCDDGPYIDREGRGCYGCGRVVHAKPIYRLGAPPRWRVAEWAKQFQGFGYDKKNIKFNRNAVLDANNNIVGFEIQDNVDSGGCTTAWRTPVPPGGRIVHFEVDNVVVFDRPPDHECSSSSKANK